MCEALRRVGREPAARAADRLFQGFDDFLHCAVGEDEPGDHALAKGEIVDEAREEILHRRFDSRHQLGWEHRGRRPVLLVERIAEYRGELALECVAQARARDLLHQVVRSEEALADRAADTLGEPRLILGDGALEAEPFLPRTEEHPHGHGIREAAGYRADGDLNRELQPGIVDRHDLGLPPRRRADI